MEIAVLAKGKHAKIEKDSFPFSWE